VTRPRFTSSVGRALRINALQPSRLHFGLYGAGLLTGLGSVSLFIVIQLVSGILFYTFPGATLSHDNFVHVRGNEVSLQVNGFYHRGTTPFEYREISVTRLFLPINSARAISYGVETTVELKHLERIGISARLQYAYQRMFFFGPISGGFAVGEEIEPGQKFLLAFDEPHSGTAAVSYRNRWRDFSAARLIRYGSGTAAGNGLVRLPTHTTADFTTGLTVWQSEAAGVRLEFNLANVSNNRYQLAKESEETPIQFGPPRIVSGRVRFTF